MIKVEKKLCEYPIKFKKIPFKKIISITPEQKGDYDYIIDQHKALDVRHALKLRARDRPVARKRQDADGRNPDAV